jgi:hypothetical protein
MVSNGLGINAFSAEVLPHDRVRYVVKDAIALAMDILLLLLMDVPLLLSLLIMTDVE